MSKRKLTKQQRGRVLRIQEQYLAALKGEESLGRVVATHGATVEVESEAGRIIHCRLRQNIEPLVAGDGAVWVADGETTGVVVAQVPRESVLARPDGSGRLKPIAANIDRIMVVVAPEPLFEPELLDRYLVAADRLAIEPIIILNKSDLLRGEMQQKIEAVLSGYSALGYTVIASSAVFEHGIDKISEALREHTSVFIGQSGVGKSSIISALLPEKSIRVGAISEAGKGRHTTTTARLYTLPFDGDLIDSPGIREFGLWHMTQEEVAEGFVEFKKELGRCKFRNCRHRDEPGCAILAAVEAGEISRARWKSYGRIVGMGR